MTATFLGSNKQCSRKGRVGRDGTGLPSGVGLRGMVCQHLEEGRRKTMCVPRTKLCWRIDFELDLGLVSLLARMEEFASACRVSIHVGVL